VSDFIRSKPVFFIRSKPISSFVLHACGNRCAAALTTGMLSRVSQNIQTEDGSSLPNSSAVGIFVERTPATTFHPVVNQLLPQGYLSEFRVQTLDNPHCEFVGYSICLCHGRWTDCHISATSSQPTSHVQKNDRQQLPTIPPHCHGLFVQCQML